MGVWMGKEEGEQLKEIVGLVEEPSEALARTVGEGVFVSLHVIINV